MPPPSPSRPRLAAAISALVLGGVGIGTTEFVTMGLLPEIAEGIGVTIPTAGHTISAYALGVVIGAPTIAVLGSKLPRRGLLIALMAVFAVANAASGLSGSYLPLMLARFAAGIPHGAFFGVASIVAFDMAQQGRGGRAVGHIMLGIPIANVAGVPLATWLGQLAGWRWAYFLVAAIGVLTTVLVHLAVPHQPRDTTASVRHEVAAFREKQVWLTLLVGAVGFGGVFAMYSYISPILRNQTDLPPDAVPVYLFIYGIGGVLGTMIAGRLVDMSVLRTLFGATIASGLALALFAWAADWAVPAGVVLLAISVAVSAFVLALQLRLMEVAGRARTLGAAGNHAALNLANALGAWLGGVVLTAGWGWRAPSLVGAGLAVGGLVLLLLSLRVHRLRGTLD
ncbi:MFS transporter [Janibacter corallicola]|uniref:MFS transporter n=1 Tax=Janibacter corallicola TaxID=415212 RepID=UPI0008329976|nr:MFS transporter [Janibacter corallicola]